MPVLNPNQPNQPDQPTQAPGSPERRQRGTGFTNIQRLLQANVGAGGVMGSAIGSGMTQKAGQLREDVTAAGQKFQQQYEKEREKALGQTGAVGSVANILSGQGDLSSLTPEEAERIGKQMREAQYGGQMGLENQEALMSRAGNVQALGTLAGMGSVGQGRLLQGIATRRGAYGRGQGLLDQYLVGQDVGAQQAIRQGAAETAGAASQALTGASVAEQQAQGLKQSIEAQKAETQRNVLSQLAGRQQEASQSAKDFLSQAERIKNIIGKNIKPEDMTMEDRMALSNLSQYGINQQVLMGADPDIVDSIINEIGSAGQVEYTGQQRFTTDAQKRAAQNLALLAGDPEAAKKIESTEFDPKVFQGANQAIEAQLGTTKQRTNELLSQLNLNENVKPSEVSEMLNTANTVLSYKDATSNESLSDKGGSNKEGNLFMLVNEDTFLQNAAKILGAQRVIDIMNARSKGGDMHDFTPYYVGQLKNAVENQLRDRQSKLSQLNDRYKSRETLQDFVNERFGLPKPALNRVVRPMPGIR